MIVKECKKHGSLTEEQCYKEKNLSYKAGFYYRCKLCRMYKRAGKAYPCKVHGPLSLEEVNAAGRCLICAREKTRKYKEENRDKYLDSKKKHRDKHADYYKKMNKILHKRRVEEYGELLSLKKVCESRRITIDCYFSMVEAQDNKCAICNKEESRKDWRDNGKTHRLCIDHSHETNKVRGLLCSKCNSALGKFNDNIKLLKSAINYLERCN